MEKVKNIKISVFAKEDENIGAIRQGLLDLLGTDIKEEKIRLHEFTAKGFNESKIKVIEARLENRRPVKSFLDHLIGLLSEEQGSMLIRQADSRLDENLHFFIRIDKEKWLERKTCITDSGNCYHIKMSIASYPKSRKTALKAVIDMFSHQKL